MVKYKGGRKPSVRWSGIVYLKLNGGLSHNNPWDMEYAKTCEHSQQDYKVM